MQHQESKTFSVDARTILQLGRQSIKDKTTALIELVKNSYDADATSVKIEICAEPKNSYIKITDNGCGMTEAVIDASWLRIGYSEKITNKVTTSKRRKTGEKGVGRLSADRLGASLELRTRAMNADAIGLRVNWNLFEVEGQDVADIPVELLPDMSYWVPDEDSAGDNPSEDTVEEATAASSHTGTQLVVYDLRDVWAVNDITTLYEELALLTPPFSGVTDFQIDFWNDISPEYNGPIKSSVYQSAILELDAELIESEVIYTLLDRSAGKSETKVVTNIHQWGELVQRVGDDLPPKGPRTGPVRLKLLFYLRQQHSVLEEGGFDLKELRGFLQQNKGVKIYRDNIRVRPYGDTNVLGGDWLGLDERKAKNPAGLGRPDYKFTANQVVGAIFVGRDNNPTLVDSNSREGLLSNGAFSDLRALTLSCLTIMEAHRYNTNKKSELPALRNAPLSSPIIRQFTANLFSLTQELEQARESLTQGTASSDEHVIRFLDRSGLIASTARATEESIKEVMSQAGVLRGLATLGISASVFGHETQTALDQFVSTTTLSKRLLLTSPPEVASAIEELEKSLKYAGQVSSWGIFSLSRVKRHKRQKRLINIDEAVLAVVKDIQPAFTAVNIALNTANISKLSAKLFLMDVEAVVLNLMTNAYVACQQRPGARVVRLEVLPAQRQTKEGFEIVVSDTGLGVPPDLFDKIWQPLVSFKKDAHGRETGTGLGLTIVESIVNEAGGEKEVSTDPGLGGARFCIWLPSS